MGSLTEHVARHVNALSVGIVSGTGVDQAQQDLNSDLLQHQADQGLSVYFPPGSYLFSKAATWTSDDNVKVWGDNALIRQTSNAVRMFEFLTCNKVEVSGLTCQTQYFISRTATVSGINETSVYVDKCNHVNVHDNIFEGFNCYVCFVRGGKWITVKSNQFRDGHWEAGLTTTADIRLDRDGTNIAEKIIIEGNQCNTESLLGISCQQPNRKLICKGNMVVSCDENGDEVIAYHPTMRKACIELQYYTDTPSGGVTAADDTLYEQVVAGNICQGCRYGGISFQDFNVSVHSGIRGVVANNELRYVGMHNDPANPADNNILGGIVVNQYRDIIITGNVLKDIPDDNPNPGHCIILQSPNERADGSNDTGPLSSAIVKGNIITDCDAKAIYLEKAGDVNIQGNILQEIRNQYIHVAVPSDRERAGHVIVTGNKLSGGSKAGQEIAVATDIIRIENGNNLTDCIVSNNFLNFTHSTFSSNYAGFLLYATRMTFTGNRMKGPGDANSIGLRLATGQALRMDSANIADNNFNSLNVGIQGSGSTTRGPWLANNTTFENCNTDILFPEQVYPGYWAGGQAVAHYNAEPTEGNWEVGDIILNTDAADGSVLGWKCIGAGAGAAATWLAMPLLAEPAIGQLVDDPTTPVNPGLTGTPVPWPAFDAGAPGQLATPNVTLDAPNATINLPVTPAAGHVYRYNVSAILTPNSNNVAYAIWAYINGVVSTDPIAIIDARQSNATTTFSSSGIIVIPQSATPSVQMLVSMDSGTDDPTWVSAGFSLERLLDL